jgi:hypothetical protein
MTGIILAGGRSTRLPNKALLPKHNGRPLITSSVDYLVYNDVKKIVVVEAEESLIRYVLQKLYPQVQFQFVCDNYAGIPAAISMVGQECADNSYAICCCDNLYPAERTIPANIDQPYAVVRQVSPNDAKHLAKWVEGPQFTGWVDRHYSTASLVALTTPWVLTADVCLAGAGEKDVTTWFNKFPSIRPREAELSTWKDLGTEDTFIRYWTHAHLQED